MSFLLFIANVLKKTEGLLSLLGLFLTVGAKPFKETAVPCDKVAGFCRRLFVKILMIALGHIRNLAAVCANKVIVAVCAVSLKALGLWQLYGKDFPVLN